MTLALILRTTDHWLLACANSAASWYYRFKLFPHKKDEAIALDIPYVERLPIGKATAEFMDVTAAIVDTLITHKRNTHATVTTIHDWLRHEFSLDKSGRALAEPQKSRRRWFRCRGARSISEKPQMVCCRHRSTEAGIHQHVDPRSHRVSQCPHLGTPALRSRQRFIWPHARGRGAHVAHCSATDAARSGGRASPRWRPFICQCWRTTFARKSITS